MGGDELKSKNINKAKSIFTLKGKDEDIRSLNYLH